MTHEEVIRVLADAVITLHRRLEAAEAALAARPTTSATPSLRVHRDVIGGHAAKISPGYSGFNGNSSTSGFPPNRTRTEGLVNRGELSERDSRAVVAVDEQ